MLRVFWMVDDDFAIDDLNFVQFIKLFVALGKTDVDIYFVFV